MGGLGHIFGEIKGIREGRKMCSRDPTPPQYLPHNAPYIYYK